MNNTLNKKIHRMLALIMGVALLWTLPMAAQVVKGSISGTVIDPQGAVVSGAQVKATNIGTGVTLSTTSDSSGVFHFNLIPVGQYKSKSRLRVSRRQRSPTLRYLPDRTAVWAQSL